MPAAFLFASSLNHFDRPHYNGTHRKRSGISSPDMINPTIARKIERGYALLRDGRTDDAEALANALVENHAESVHSLVFAGEVALESGDSRAALFWIDKAISTSGGDPFLKIKKARLLAMMRRRYEVAELAAEIGTQAGKNGSVHWQVGGIYYRSNLQAQAIAHYETARSLLGDQPRLLYDLGVARFFSGDFERVENDLGRMLELAPQSGHALYLRATLRRQTPGRNHVDDLKRRLERGFKEPVHEAAALYALGKELEDLGDHESSFAAFMAGSAKKRSTMRYRIEDEIASLRAVRETYTDKAMTRPGPGHEEEGAIFIVGMPRTGTTLVERMLVQTGKVTGAGELLDFGSLLQTAARKRIAADQRLSPAAASLDADFAALGKDYMRGAREAAGGSPWFIDKMPINYLYCGMIRKALPKAKIIHVVRKPLDSCYAIFKTLFFNAYNFSYDLEELGEYYVAYHQMMQHWHAVMPGAILDVHYEDLVHDTENQARRILDWVGFEWDPDVLDMPKEGAVFATASAAQVREPVYTRSVNSARRHREGLLPLIRKLEAAGIVDS